MEAIIPKHKHIKNIPTYTSLADVSKQNSPLLFQFDQSSPSVSFSSYLYSLLSFRPFLFFGTISSNSDYNKLSHILSGTICVSFSGEILSFLCSATPSVTLVRIFSSYTWILCLSFFFPRYWKTVFLQ